MPKKNSVPGSLRQDRARLHEFHDRLIESGFRHHGLKRILQKITELRKAGGTDAIYFRDDKVYRATILSDGSLGLSATFLGKEWDPTDQFRGVRAASRAWHRKGGEGIWPPPGWEMARRVVLGPEGWIEPIRPSSQMVISETPFKPDIEWIAKVVMRGYWAIRRIRFSDDATLHLGGQEVPAKSSDPMFRAALIPYLQRGKVTLQVKWGEGEGDVETIHITVEGRRILVVWDGPASGKSA